MPPLDGDALPFSVPFKEYRVLYTPPLSMRRSRICQLLSKSNARRELDVRYVFNGFLLSLHEGPDDIGHDYTITEVMVHDYIRDSKLC